MKTLALVPARSGSKGIPGKNTRLFAGKPLLAWAVEVGRQTCDATYVTTDDPNIGLFAAQFGASTIVRPVELATDDAPMLPVIQHALGMLACDVVVLLQPTQPLRTMAHVRLALEMLTDDWDSVVSVVQIPAHYSPDYAVMVHGERLFVPPGPTRRQDARLAYSRDGTVYVVRRETIEAGEMYGDSRAFVIPAEESVNLDTEDDWQRAEQMVSTYALR